MMAPLADPSYSSSPLASALSSPTYGRFSSYRHPIATSLISLHRIIVGVKYCFRYNQRNRQGLGDLEAAERFDLGPMQRTRRRREKKLMSMDEVNDRFPLTRYKIWRSTREHEGLPSSGGISAPLSRSNSVRHNDALKRVSTEDTPAVGAPEIARVDDAPATPDPSTEARDFAQGSTSASTDRDVASGEIGVRKSVDSRRASTENSKGSSPESATADIVESQPKAAQQPEKASVRIDEKTNDEEEDPINTAVPAEYFAQPGDACAICIEGLEDDDEVRGLACGHAFHASCIDPWLTSRRACCPLCKADYYVPKPRPEGDGANQDGAEQAETNSLPQPPAAVWRGFRSRNAQRSGAQTGSPLARFWIRDRTRQPRNHRDEVPAHQTSSGRGSRPARPTTWIRTLPERLPWVGVSRDRDP